MLSFWEAMGSVSKLNKKNKPLGGDCVTIPKDPWDWYICLHLADFYGFHVGKYTIHGSSGYTTCSWQFCEFVTFLGWRSGPLQK